MSDSLSNLFDRLTLFSDFYHVSLVMTITIVIVALQIFLNGGPEDLPRILFVD
jgi:hypothetical protein